MKPIITKISRQPIMITNREAVRKIQSNDIPKCSLRKVEIKLPDCAR